MKRRDNVVMLDVWTLVILVGVSFIIGVMCGIPIKVPAKTKCGCDGDGCRMEARP